VAGQENLLKAEDLTSEELRKRATNGGIASGKARREKKAMKDTLAALLSMPLKSGKATDIETIKNLASVKGKNITVQEAIMLAQIQKAMKGDTRAAEFVRDSSGNKLKEGIEISGEVNNPFADLSTEDLKKLIVDD
jgi:hypothetical protein